MDAGREDHRRQRRCLGHFYRRWSAVHDAVFLFQFRITLDNDKRLGEDDFALVDECMANTLWAILWGVTLAVYLIVCDAGKWICNDSWGPALTGIAVAGTVHFLLVIGMCLKRLRRAYERIAMKRP